MVQMCVSDYNTIVSVSIVNVVSLSIIVSQVIVPVCTVIMGRHLTSYTLQVLVTAGR